MSDKRESLSIVYEEAPNKPTYAITGAYGGTSPDGTMVIVHVYTDFGTIPSIEEHEVKEDGSIDTTKGHKIKRADVTRQIHANLAMSPEAALSLSTFLKEKAGIALKARESR